jgi:methylmalonyl-CoA mutase cobalamin-binding domain/chain
MSLPTRKQRGIGMNEDGSIVLGQEGLNNFQRLRADAVREVTDRFYAAHGAFYERFGQKGRDACREDLDFHLEFLRPALEFGLLQPMVDYLRWLDSVLTARKIPTGHLAQSLDWLAEYFAMHMEPSAGAAVASTLQAVRAQFVAAGSAPQPPMTAPAAWPEAAGFEAALLAGKQRDALDVVNRCLDEGRKLIDIELHVIEPSLYRIGERWQCNEVTVAQEHMATAIVESVMTVALLRSPPPVPINKRILLACVEGNNHAVGLRMVADAFLLAGWDVQYLGANVPTSALVQQATEWKPDLVGLSVSFAQQLRVVKAVIAELGDRLGAARPAVIVGGLAINRFKQLVDVIGADASSVDAQGAVDSASHIIDEQARH